MIFLLGVLVGGLLVCLPLVVIVLTARCRGDELEAVALAELQMRSIKRDTVRQVFRAVDHARGGMGAGGGRLGQQFDGSDSSPGDRG